MSAERLEGIIAEICTKISTLNRREAEINRNTTSEVDVVEKDVLLRRIRSERRELNKELAERSSQKAMLDNNVEAAEEASSDDDEDEEIDPEAADTLQLADDQTEEFNRLNNLLARNKNDIKARKIKVEKFLKESSSPYLTDTEKRLIDIQIKSQLRSVAELVSSYKNLSKYITKICNFGSLVWTAVGYTRIAHTVLLHTIQHNSHQTL